MITVSVPGKIHLLGEHMVVYGKPALLAAISLRVTVSISPANHFSGNNKLRDIIESIIKDKLKIRRIPLYKLEISSQIPVGSGIGSSAAISAAYTAALLSFLKVKWDLDLVNNLTYEAEKAFHGNPSGGDNSTVVYGGLLWFRKESPDLKIIQPLNLSIPPGIAKNFYLMNSGTPVESTKEMVEMVGTRSKSQKTKFKKILDQQERLVRELLPAIEEGDEKKLVRIIREGEKNLEGIGVVSTFTKSIIRKIEQAGGAAKICGAGGRSGPAGMLLCYHPKPLIIQNIAKAQHMDYIRTVLGAPGLRQE